MTEKKACNINGLRVHGAVKNVDTWHCEVACHATASYRLGMAKTKPKPTTSATRRLARATPTAPADRAALLSSIIAAIPILGSAQAACRRAGVAQGTFHRWLDAAPQKMRDEYASARRAIARQAIDAMASICATATARTLAHSDLEQEAHYAHHIAPIVRWHAERILPEYAPRSESTVSVRIDIRSTLAQMIDSVDAADVIDADDLPALPAQADYAGD